jgi:type IV secretion system protein VirB1
MMECQNLAVSASVMRHIVSVESGANPYAIGVVGRRLVRQPKTLDEAVATARSLEASGYNFSLGLSQINRANLGKYGLDTFEKAFDPCANLSVGSRILADCYTSAGGNWGRAFSCYYSGNFVSGFRDNYVQRIYESISRGSAVADSNFEATALPLQQSTRPTSSSSRAASRSSTAGATDVFIPQVHGPNGPPTTTTATDAGQADLRERDLDAALVF